MRKYSDAVFEVQLQAGTKRYKGVMIQRWQEREEILPDRNLES